MTSTSNSTPAANGSTPSASLQGLPNELKQTIARAIDVSTSEGLQGLLSLRRSCRTLQQNVDATDIFPDFFKNLTVHVNRDSIAILSEIANHQHLSKIVEKVSITTQCFGVYLLTEGRKYEDWD
ncbi:hypothetical protein EJ08DRAFT_70969 [Tothia fuscella]|uniref:Uncharacterized protein n=1 Tax=Tothia fuscella TaxID=1048955 RepID=A0A9P4NEX7_9PEZI|nr:hypothetical protein EJ08DRAFT_70969 [Tothia fuscella]